MTKEQLIAALLDIKGQDSTMSTDAKIDALILALNKSCATCEWMHDLTEEGEMVCMNCDDYDNYSPLT